MEEIQKWKQYLNAKDKNVWSVLIILQCLNFQVTNNRIQGIWMVWIPLTLFLRTENQLAFLSSCGETAQSAKARRWNKSDKGEFPKSSHHYKENNSHSTVGSQTTLLTTPDIRILILQAMLICTPPTLTLLGTVSCPWAGIMFILHQTSVRSPWRVKQLS